MSLFITYALHLLWINEISGNVRNSDITIGSCVWVRDRQCPDPEISFQLYTNSNPTDGETIMINESQNRSSLSNTSFVSENPTKIILHGFKEDMSSNHFEGFKEEYFNYSDYNIFFVNYSTLIDSCYLAAVHNIKHVGNCIGQLVDEIRETGSSDVHLIGFSLGAHVANYVSQAVRPFVLPRITGLDPSLLFFFTLLNDHKLDSSDAEFVDIFHTNSFHKGKVERSGHVDFYFNGGANQPGCEDSGCSHQRAVAYYIESIQSPVGFWGWGCSLYINYLIGLCPPTNFLVQAGEHSSPKSKGMYFLTTHNSTPYAQGKWSEYPDNQLF